MYILYEKSMHGNINVILETVCVKLQVWAGNHPKRKQLLIRKLIRCRFKFSTTYNILDQGLPLTII